METCTICKDSKDDSDGKKYTPKELISKLPLSDTTFPAKKIADEIGKEKFMGISAAYANAASIIKFNNPPGAASHPLYWICNECSSKYFKSKVESKSGCFIATACYNDPYCQEVLDLKFFRDHYLLKFPFGKELVSIYYMLSPSLVKFIGSKSIMKNLTRRYFLDLLLIIIRRLRN